MCVEAKHKGTIDSYQSFWQVKAQIRILLEEGSGPKWGILSDGVSWRFYAATPKSNSLNMTSFKLGHTEDDFVKVLEILIYILQEAAAS